MGHGSLVGIATDYGLDGPGLNPVGDEIFPPSRPALVPTQPPVQWVPGLSRGYRRPGRAANNSPPSSAQFLEKSRAIPVRNLRDFVVYKMCEANLAILAACERDPYCIKHC